MTAASLPTPAATPPARRSRALLTGIALYLVLTLAALLGEQPALAAGAVFVLLAALLAAPLRAGRLGAWGVLVAAGAGIAWLAAHGAGWLLLDAVPVLVNAALCGVFARTLGAGRTPLIARFIAILEGPERLRDARIVRYARWLTWAWALLLGAQAWVLAAIVLAMPQGVLALLGIAPAWLVSPLWSAYLHAGSYLLVALFLLLEYACRRVHLRQVAHPSLPAFVLSLIRCWPALLRSAFDDAPRSAA